MTPTPKRAPRLGTPEQRQAKADGYARLTTPYLDRERDMMEKEAKFLSESGVELIFVRGKDGTEIWRKGYKEMPKH